MTDPSSEASTAAPNPNEASAAGSGGYAAGEQAPAPDMPPSALRKSRANSEANADGKERCDSDGGKMKKVPTAGKVQFDLTPGTSTVKAYTPSDSSEEWDPNNEDEPSDDENAPGELFGYLWKKSPSKLIFCKYQKRYFQLRNAKLFWWYSEDDFKKGRKRSRGSLDLKQNQTQVVKDGKTRFNLSPLSGQWAMGNFTGADAGRAFYLDSEGSEHPQDKWIEAFQAHIKYADEPSRF